LNGARYHNLTMCCSPRSLRSTPAWRRTLQSKSCGDDRMRSSSSSRALGSSSSCRRRMPRITHPDVVAGCLPSASAIAFTCKPKRSAPRLASSSRARTVASPSELAHIHPKRVLAPSYPVVDVVNRTIEKDPTRPRHQTTSKKKEQNTCSLCAARFRFLDAWSSRLATSTVAILEECANGDCYPLATCLSCR